VLLSWLNCGSLGLQPSRPATSKGGPRAYHGKMSYVQGRTASRSHWLLQRGMLPESGADQALARPHCCPSTPATWWPQALAFRPRHALYPFVSYLPRQRSLHLPSRRYCGEPGRDGSRNRSGCTPTCAGERTSPLLKAAAVAPMEQGGSEKAPASAAMTERRHSKGRSHRASRPYGQWSHGDGPS